MSKITYTNKVALNENIDIPNENKITDDDMNEIKTVVNNNDDELITINTKLTNANAYSTTETVVGTWMNKPLYRKTVDTGALPSIGGKTINHNISNIDYVTKIIGTAYRNTDNVFLPLPHATYDNTAISCYCDKTLITIIVYTDRSAFQESYVTLEYTKTTDV